jgi:hypothetical protein
MVVRDRDVERTLPCLGGFAASGLVDAERGGSSV